MRSITIILLLMVSFVLAASILGCNTDNPIQITSNKPADFLVSNLTISPVEIEYLDVVTITVNVTNKGGSPGIYDVVLYINGLEEGAKGITLAPGSSDIITFFVNRPDFGIYYVEIDELVGSFAVVEPWPFGE
jgi:hypothetical protein